MGKIDKEANKLFIYTTLIGGGVGLFVGFIAGIAFDVLPFIGIFVGVGASLGVLAATLLITLRKRTK